MKTYTYQIGTGSGDEIEKVTFSQELVAYSLDEAVDKAKATTRGRPEHANEVVVRLLDETRNEGQSVWSRSAEDIRSA